MVLCFFKYDPFVSFFQDVSREFKSTLEREIGLDEVQNPIQKNYSSSATNTNSIPIATETNTIPSTIDKPENSPIKSETSKWSFFYLFQGIPFILK